MFRIYLTMKNKHLLLALLERISNCVLEKKKSTFQFPIISRIMGKSNSTSYYKITQKKKKKN